MEKGWPCSRGEGPDPGMKGKARSWPEGPDPEMEGGGEGPSAGEAGRAGKGRLTVWLAPHMRTLSSGSEARNSFTFWHTKCFFLVLVLLALSAAPSAAAAPPPPAAPPAQLAAMAAPARPGSAPC